MHSDTEYRAEYSHGEPNIELYILSLNKVLNRDLEGRKVLHSDVEYSAEYRTGNPIIELYIQMVIIVLNIDLEGQLEPSNRSLNIVMKIDLDERL